MVNNYIYQDLTVKVGKSVEKPSNQQVTHLTKKENNNNINKQLLIMVMIMMMIIDRPLENRMIIPLTTFFVWPVIPFACFTYYFVLRNHLLQQGSRLTF